MRVHECANVFGACDGDWSDVDSLCDDCRIERESALIDAAMDAQDEQDVRPMEAV
jgi:hypothetical protein